MAKKIQAEPQEKKKKGPEAEETKASQKNKDTATLKTPAEQQAAMPLGPAFKTMDYTGEDGKTYQGSAHLQEVISPDPAQKASVLDDYMLMLPTESEHLRSYFQDDNYLSNEEITRAIYDKNTTGADLKVLVDKVADGIKIEERSPALRAEIADYLKDVHASFQASPLAGFVQPGKTYQVVVESNEPKQQEKQEEKAGEKAGIKEEANPVKSKNPLLLLVDLKLLQGSMMANLIHNANNVEGFLVGMAEKMAKLPKIVAVVEPEKALKEKIETEKPNSQEKSQTPIPVESKSVSVVNPVAQPEQTIQKPGILERIGNAVKQMVVPTSNANSASATLTSTAQSTPAPATAAVTEPNPQTKMAQSTVSEKEPTSRLNSKTELIQSAVTNATGSQLATRWTYEQIAPQIEKNGVDKAFLQTYNALNDLLMGRRTPMLNIQQVDDKGTVTPMSGKLYITESADGKGPIVFLNVARQEISLPKSFLGYALTTEDKTNLTKNGEMNKLITMRDKVSGENFKGYVGLDPHTKRLTVLRQEYVKMPTVIRGTTLTPEQSNTLSNGKPIIVDFTDKDGKERRANVQITASRREGSNMLAITVLPGRKPKQEQTPVGATEDQKVPQPKGKEQTVAQKKTDEDKTPRPVDKVQNVSVQTKNGQTVASQETSSQKRAAGSAPTTVKQNVSVNGSKTSATTAANSQKSTTVPKVTPGEKVVAQAVKSKEKPTIAKSYGPKR